MVEILVAVKVMVLVLVMEVVVLVIGTEVGKDIAVAEDMMVMETGCGGNNGISEAVMRVALVVVVDGGR